MESPGWKVYICVPRGLEWLSGCGTVSSSSVFLQVNGDPYSSKGEPCPFLANRLHVSSAAISWLLTASSFFSLISLFIYLFVCLFVNFCLRCCAQAFSICGERGLLFIEVHGLLIVVASLVAEHGL